MTEAELVDRIRTVVGARAGLKEARGLDLGKTPGTSIDGAFTVRFFGGDPIGGFNMTEEVRGVVEIVVGRAVNNNHDRARRVLLQDARGIVNDVIIDGTRTSGDYCIEDGGRSVEVIDPDGASYFRTEIRIPVNFETVIDAEE